jgi:NADH dehydrogenase/NADH:ubiquinone oxidoreductase subunit G
VIRRVSAYLQDYSFNYGRGYSRLNEPKNIKPDKTYIGDQITLFTDRCIMCTRCVRFTREVSGSAELQVVSRGSHEEIDIFPGHPVNNPLAGNVVDLCPVGALCSKDFLYQQRVWWLKSAVVSLSRLQHGLQCHRRSERRTRLPTSSTAQTKRPRVTSCAMKVVSAGSIRILISV